MDSRAWIIPFERWIIYRGVENPVIRCRKGTLNKLKELYMFLALVLILLFLVSIIDC